MKILVSRSYRDIDRYNGSYRAAPPSGPASRGWPSSGYSSGYTTPSGRPVSPDARGSAAWNERERDRYDRDRVYDRDSTFYRRSSREDYREAPRTQPSSYDKDGEENHEGRFRQSDWTGSRSFPRDNWRRSPSTNRSASPRSSRRSSPPSIRVPSPLPARDWRESEDQQRQSSRHDDTASGTWTNASRLPLSSPASHNQGMTPGSRSSLSAAPPRRRDTQVSSSTLEDHASPRDAFRKEARTDHQGSVDAKLNSAFKSSTKSIRSLHDMYMSTAQQSLRKALHDLADSDVELAGARLKTSITEAALERAREDAEAWSIESARLGIEQRNAGSEGYWTTAAVSADNR